MLVMRLILSLLILPYIICPPQVYAQTFAKAEKKEMLYQKVMGISEKKMALVMKHLPQGNVLFVEAEKNNSVKQELKERIKTLKEASNAEVALFKKELIKLNEQELSANRAELVGYLNAMSDKEINEIGQFLKAELPYEEASILFQNSFTMNEKRNAVKSALMKDLSFLRSMYNKKIGYSTKEALVQDLEQNLTIMESSQSNKSKIGEILKISLIALAGVALVTWGISSAVYGARLNRIKNERETKLTDLKKTLEAQYNAYKEELTQNELNYLANNGYIRTVCGTFTQADSILCNRYNYQLFSGTKYCQVYCYKNLATGKETLHEPAVCTSPFIPNDCYNPQEYWDAHARGKKDGYNDGYDDGEYDGREDGASEGRYNGDSDGYDDGYDTGYSHGYDDGYDSGAASVSKSVKFKNLVPFKQSEAYLQGFRDGYEQYQILFLNY